MKIKLLHKLRKEGFKADPFTMASYMNRIDMWQVKTFYNNNMWKYIPNMLFHEHWHESSDFRDMIREKYRKFSRKYALKY